jgi:ribosomal protein S18 acetylase RimI-like enzyme
MKTFVRPAQVSDAEAIARVHIDTWRTTYAGIMPAEHLAKLSYEDRAAGWRNILANPDNPAFTLVAEANEEVLGFATGGPERAGHPLYKAEISGIYVLEAWQRQGIGRQLTLAVVEGLQQRGFASMLVWVLKDNPCRGFYERLSGMPAGEKPVEIGGKKLVLAAYGWRDLAELAGKEKKE